MTVNYNEITLNDDSIILNDVTIYLSEVKNFALKEEEPKYFKPFFGTLILGCFSLWYLTTLNHPTIFLSVSAILIVMIVLSSILSTKYIRITKIDETIDLINVTAIKSDDRMNFITELWTRKNAHQQKVLENWIENELNAVTDFLDNNEKLFPKGKPVSDFSNTELKKNNKELFDRKHLAKWDINKVKQIQRARSVFMIK